MNWSRIAERTIKPSTHTEEVIFSDGDTNDIVSVILHADTLAKEFTERFAPYLRGQNVKDTTKKIWDFVKTNIRYKRDQTGHERVKSPGKLWADKEGDCKSMSVFIASILQNLGIPYKYRFAHYPNAARPFDKDVNHVFVVAIDERGGEIPVDTVADRWNYEEPYEHCFDHETDHQAAASVSGIFPSDMVKMWLPVTISFFIGYITATIIND